MMRAFPGVLLLALFLLGCDAAKEGIQQTAAEVTEAVRTEDGWTPSSTSSALDGNVVVATRDFRPAGSTAFVRTALACYEQSGNLTLTLTSLNVDEGNVQHSGSPLRLDEGGAVAGRIRLAPTSRSQIAPSSAGDLFVKSAYDNEASWRVADLSALEWLSTDDDGAWTWAATVVGARQPQDQRPSVAQLKEGFRSFVTAAAYSSAAEGIALSEFDVAYAFASEIVDSAAVGGALKPLGAGAFLRARLPFTVEVFNTGGAVEISIVGGNRVVDDVLKRCEGSEWWKSPAAPGAP